MLEYVTDTKQHNILLYNKETLFSFVQFVCSVKFCTDSLMGRGNPGTIVSHLIIFMEHKFILLYSHVVNADFLLYGCD